MIAFVAGATGYVGQHVVAELRRRQIEAIAHIRPDSSREELIAQFEREDAQIDRTPWQVEEMTRSITRHAPDLVFCLIGTTRSRMKEADDGEDQSYEAIDYGLTRQLLDACSAQGEPPRFVYLSALGADSSGLNAYTRARHKADQAVLHSQIPYLIARAGLITGPDRDEARPLEQLAGRLGRAVLRGSSPIAKRYRPLTADELARSLVAHALREPRAQVVVEAEDLGPAQPS